MKIFFRGGEPINVKIMYRQDDFILLRRCEEGSATEGTDELVIPPAHVCSHSLDKKATQPQPSFPQQARITVLPPRREFNSGRQCNDVSGAANACRNWARYAARKCLH